MNGLPEVFCELLQRLGEHLKGLDRQVDALDAQIQRWPRKNAASALVASIGDAKAFEDGRQFAA